jgi:hypothetical protein
MTDFNIFNFESYTYLQIIIVLVILLILGYIGYRNISFALTQVIISLIILLLMGYIGYNIYLIELQNMFQGENDLRKEIVILNGAYDFINTELKFPTTDKSEDNFKDIRPSKKQGGGAEYSYNFWLCINQTKLKRIAQNPDEKDIILFLKGEKNFYYNSVTNYNCATGPKNRNAVIITKNPLVRLSGDGAKIVIEYNNIYNSDSYQNNSTYTEGDACKLVDYENWINKNKNLLGIYDIEFDNKWFMITIVMKEVADSNNVLSYNRASCKMYINGVKLLDKKVETKYNNNIHSATFKNNTSPFYVNPGINTDYIKITDNPYNNKNITEKEILQIADIKYYNYSLNEDIILSLYNKGVNSEIATFEIKKQKYMATNEDMEDSNIKEI